MSGITYHTYIKTARHSAQKRLVIIAVRDGKKLGQTTLSHKSIGDGTVILQAMARLQQKLSAKGIIK